MLRAFKERLGLKPAVGRSTRIRDLVVELPSKPGKGDFRYGCRLGAYSYVNGTSRFYTTDVGRFCGIGTNVIIGGPEHPTDRISIHPFAYSDRTMFDEPDYSFMETRNPISALAQTRVGNDVWIGALSYVRRGVTIGDGAVIGAGSVVTKDVPPYAVVAGSPARILRYRFAPAIVERLLALKWWNYFPDRDIVGDWNKPIEEVVASFEAAISGNRLRLLTPEVVTS